MEALLPILSIESSFALTSATKIKLGAEGISIPLKFTVCPVTCGAVTDCVVTFISGSSTDVIFNERGLFVIPVTGITIPRFTDFTSEFILLVTVSFSPPLSL